MYISEITLLNHKTRDTRFVLVCFVTVLVQKIYIRKLKELTKHH